MQTYEKFLKKQSGGVHHQKGMLLVLGGDVFMLEMGQKNKKRRNLCCFRFVEKTNGRLRFLVCGEAMLNFYF